MSEITVDGKTTRYYNLGYAQVVVNEPIKSGTDYVWMFRGKRQI